MRYEYAETLLDIIARRTRIAFLNSEASLAVLARLLWCMAKERNWSAETRLREMGGALKFLRSMNRKKPSNLLRLQLLQVFPLPDPHV
jgi:glycerol-3-phosphate dehydrogenase